MKRCLLFTLSTFTKYISCVYLFILHERDYSCTNSVLVETPHHINKSNAFVVDIEIASANYSHEKALIEAAAIVDP